MTQAQSTVYLWGTCVFVGVCVSFLAPIDLCIIIHFVPILCYACLELLYKETTFMEYQIEYRITSL